jgi:hypothetical protein
LEPVYVVHYHDYAARLQGTQIAYDVGVQRMCWQVQSLTNRMGDAGTLKHIHGQSAPWGTNRRRQNVMPGTAAVVLPRRP